MFLRFNLKHTKNYATQAAAEAAAVKLVGNANLPVGALRCIVATQDGRFIPVLHLRNSDATMYAAAFASRGFYVFN